MNRDLKNIDRLFHDELARATDQPPLKVWDGISGALDRAEETALNDRKKRRYVVAAVLFFIITSTAGIVWSVQESDTDDKQVVSNSQHINSGEKNASVSVQQNIISGNKINSEKEIVTAEKNEVRVDLDLPVALLKTYPATQYMPGKEKAIKDQTESAGIAQQFDEPLFNRREAIALINTGSRIDATAAKNELSFVMDQYTALGAAKNISNASVATRRKSKLSFIFFFAPDITTRNLEQDLGSTIDERKEEILRTEKNGALDFTFGARVEYRLNKKLSLQSGLSFSTNTIDIAQKTVFARVDNKDGALKYRFNLSSGYAFFKLRKIPPPQFVGDSTQVSSSQSTLHYVNIPLALKYYFVAGKRVSFTAQAGITARFITKQSIHAEYTANGDKEKSVSNQIQGLKTTYFNGVIGVGAEYALNQRTALTVFPSFNFATSSINRDAPVKAYPNTLSIAAGVKIDL